MNMLNNFFIGLLGILCVAMLASAKDVNVNRADMLRHQFKSAESQTELSQSADMLQRVSSDMSAFLQQAMQQTAKKKRIEFDMENQISVQTVIPEFIRQYHMLSDQEKSDLQGKPNMLAKSAALDGGIAGRVTVNGAVPDSSIDVLVFNSHGYFAGSASVSNENGDYSVTNLPSDSFYVVAVSEWYLDEIYDNVTSPLFSMQGWRSAAKVAVNQAITEGIHFDLQSGTRVSGSLFQADGSTVVDADQAVFAMVRSTTGETVWQSSEFLTNGRFEFIFPSTGDYKLRVEVRGYQTTWYPSASNQVDGQIVSVTTGETAKDNINFTLTEDPQAQSYATISGTVGSAVEPLKLFFPALVGVFNAEDTSFVDFALQLTPLLGFSFNDLAPGSYLVYANDLYLGGPELLFSIKNYQGQFFGETIILTAGQVKAGVGILLPEGGTISGNVTNTEGTALDSLTVLAMNADIFSAADDPFLTRFELAQASTDAEGNFSLTGLQSGEYVVRTVSDYSLAISSLDQLANALQPGKHAGTVVDEYYGGIHNLVRWNQASTVSVTSPNVTANINFQLQRPHFITGRVTDAESGLGVQDITIAALDDTSGYPYIPIAAIDSSGSYVLGPLPQGRFKVLAVTGFNGNSRTYLSEYFNNTRSFYSASSINLSEDVISGVDFALEKGGTIQGFVDLQSGAGMHHAGADTLHGMPVIAYDTANGDVAALNWVQFNGGFRIDKLLPGSYKVAVLPTPSDYAVTYLGGGATYDDTNSETVTVSFGQVQEGTIELQQASASISGHVLASDSNEPLSGVLVAAYDTTGHAVGFAMTDFDMSTASWLETNGAYRIDGLRPGNYYVRTLYLSSALTVVEDVLGIVDMFSGLELDAILGGNLPNLNFSLDAYMDQWYNQVDATVNINVDELAFKITRYGLQTNEFTALLPIFLPIPFYSPIPETVQAVQISQGSTITNLDFNLTSGALLDLFTGVQDESPQQSPDAFSLNQNYPNPFNPSTQISFTLPQQELVRLRVYDALGRHIRTLTERHYTAGEYTIHWDGRTRSGDAAAAGIYFARITAGDYSSTIKMLLVK